MSSTSIEEAKRRLPLPLLLKQLGLGEHAKKTARCPFHEDRNPSFSVFQIGAPGSLSVMPGVVRGMR